MRQTTTAGKHRFGRWRAARGERRGDAPAGSALGHVLALAATPPVTPARALAARLAAALVARPTAALAARLAAALAVVLAVASAVPVVALAQASGANPTDRVEAEPVLPAVAPAGAIHGRVVDATTGDPLAAVYVRLRELGRNEFSHRDGTFHFDNLGPGTYTITAQRLGYAPLDERVTVTGEETLTITLRMRPTALEISGLIVTATGRERAAGDAYRPMAVVGDAELRRRVTTSVAATIAHLPGIVQQYNGPAASQPVIRGMGGDRVLVLEDGQRTGDLSSTAADHAVAVDPVSAKRIEVVRGPAALLYGSNALGGVINVIREEVPRTMPESATGAASLLGASVNRGGSGGGYVLVPVGRLALRAEAIGRAAGDTRTPEGVLPSTDLRGFDGAVGASWIDRWGYVGAAFRDHLFHYGIPGEFDGQVIPGAHPGGVEAETRRRAGRVEAAHLTGLGPFARVRFEGNVVHYKHDEIERRADGETFYGTRFDQVTGGANVLAQHDHDIGEVRREGALGIAALGRSLQVSGRFSGTRPAWELGFAGFAYEEFGWRRFRVELGARYDYRRVVPRDDSPIRIRDREVPVRERTFGDASGSLALLYDLRPGWTIGASLARAFRTPSVEEMYSDGPHLADFSFNVGNPELKSEYGLGVDVFARVARPGVEAEMSVFRNRVSNYIHYAPTGELDPRFQRFPVFQARGDDALFTGAEGRVQWEAAPRIVLDVTVSHVRGTRQEDDDPLPAIPPLNGVIGARYDAQSFFVSLGWDGSAAQNRVPRAVAAPGETEEVLLERPTPGYGLVNAALGFRFTRRDQFHTLTLRVDNVADSVWRDHLSRIKEVAPQPGRNVQLLYRVHF